MTKVLVIEDDPAILRGIQDSLSFEGYDVIIAADGDSAYHSLKAATPDLIILDLMLPDIYGVDLCRKLRAENVHTPILMLTAKDHETDRVDGLDSGADDYMTKPFSVRELLARIRAILRRTQHRPDEISEIQIGDVHIHFRRFEARRNGDPFEMTRKEFAILKLLAGREGEVVTREELLDDVWGAESYPVSRTVDYHIVGLRAKLESDPAHPRFIKTVHRVGY
jgi:DNA-binding response OmpR family regulator